MFIKAAHGYAPRVEENIGIKSVVSLGKSQLKPMKIYMYIAGNNLDIFGKK